MSCIRTGGLAFLVLVFPVTLLGCGRGKPDAPENAAQFGNLRQIHDLYASYTKNHQQPPKQFSDLNKKEYDMIYPGTLKVVKDGDYVVVWGVDVNKDPGKVLAYEKAAPTDGGAVITADGTPRIMSAADVQAALQK